MLVGAALITPVDDAVRRRVRRPAPPAAPMVGATAEEVLLHRVALAVHRRGQEWSTSAPVPGRWHGLGVPAPPSSKVVQEVTEAAATMPPADADHAGVGADGGAWRTTPPPGEESDEDGFTDNEG